MFKSSYQSGFLSLLYSIGSKPLSIWSSEGACCWLRAAAGRFHGSPLHTACCTQLKTDSKLHLVLLLQWRMGTSNA